MKLIECHFNKYIIISLLMMPGSLSHPGSLSSALVSVHSTGLSNEVRATSPGCGDHSQTPVLLGPGPSLWMSLLWMVSLWTG